MQPTYCRGRGVNETQSIGSDAIRAIVIYRVPRNDQDALLGSFGAAVGPSVASRYNLAWGYGDYLLDVSRFLGTNDALDAAVATVSEAHLLFCRRQSPTVGCLRTYGLALRRLRTSLDDPVVAQSDAVLYAVMVLMVCQVYKMRGVHRLVPADAPCRT